MEHKKLECYRCKKLLADNLVLPKGLCVYCAADEADQLPQPQKQVKINKREERQLPPSGRKCSVEEWRHGPKKGWSLGGEEGERREQT